MPIATSLAAVITATATALIALGGVITAVTVLVPLLRQTRALGPKVDEVHKIVNQQRTDMERYTVALIAALEKAGVEVPTDQSKPLPEGGSGAVHGQGT